MTVRYVGKVELSLPAWALTTRGHDYASWVLRAFPYLKSYRKGPNDEPEDKLVAAIARDLAQNFSGLLPEAVASLFRHLSDGSGKCGKCLGPRG